MLETPKDFSTRNSKNLKYEFYKIYKICYNNYVNFKKGNGQSAAKFSFMYGYIYKTTNLIDNKVYIGQHRSDKFDTEYYGSGIHIVRAVKRFGIKNFKTEIIDIAYNDEDLDCKEKNFIKYYREELGYENVYNISNGGFGAMALETRQKISKTLTGRKNKPHSKQTRQKIGDGNRGKVRTKEMRQRVSKTKQNNPRIWINNGKKQLNILKSDFDKYPNYQRGMLKTGKPGAVKNKIAIIKDSKVKYITKNELNYYLSSGYCLIKDSNTDKFKTTLGHKRMFKNDIVKYIPFEKINNYLEDGWILGTPESKIRRGFKHSEETKRKIKISTIKTKKVQRLSKTDK